jgi:ABC-type multidrug transport system ATPase subunit/ABC-type multidrug transport system permease subunit
MEWTDISLTINEKMILSSVSGSANVGEMACILGPSGAGKSTLLNVLAGRMNTKAKGTKMTGEVSLGGCIVDPVAARSNIAYVMQEDALPRMSTPREVLEMAAVLRGKVAKKKAATDNVNELLAALKLEKCADTYVGSALVKGLSGGEKKRTSVAVELITAPRMIFLDEPLSGLDSYAAYTVVQVLRGLALQGCAVLCTIHQPSSEIFQSFDKMICLVEGRTVYCDDVGGLSRYMAKLQRPVPTETNPADHILFFVQTQTKEELASFTSSWSAEERNRVLAPIAAVRSASEAVPPRAVHRKSFFVQLGFLIQREGRELLRNKIGLLMRFGVTGVMGCLFAFIFQNIGRKDDQPGGLQGHFGAICNVLIGTMFGAAQPLLIQFPSERPIFLREYAANMYGTVPYFLAKTCVEIPVAFLTALENWSISYSIMGFSGNFFYLVIVGWAMTLTASSTALFVSCSVANAQSSQELAPLIFVPQILFTGIFVPIALVPVWLRWLQYVAALKYAINLACIVEFDSVPGGDALLRTQDIDKDKAWLYVLTLASIFAGFRILAIVNLRRKASFVF